MYMNYQRWLYLSSLIKVIWILQPSTALMSRVNARTFYSECDLKNGLLDLTHRSLEINVVPLVRQSWALTRHDWAPIFRRWFPESIVFWRVAWRRLLYLRLYIVEFGGTTKSASSLMKYWGAHYEFHHKNKLLLIRLNTKNSLQKAMQQQGVLLVNTQKSNWISRKIRLGSGTF